MIVSEMFDTNFTYYSLHAEEVLSSNFIEENQSGIYCDKLLVNTVNRLKDHIEKKLIPKTSIRNVVFDFDKIFQVDPNAKKSIAELKKLGFNITFINVQDAIIEGLGFESFNNDKNISVKNTFKCFHLFEEEEKVFIDESFSSYKLFTGIFKKTLIEKYVDSNGRKHTSSDVYLTSFIDLKRFMSHEKPFFIYSLYRLANKINAEWGTKIDKEQRDKDNEGEQEKIQIDKNTVLVCQSLNSSYIASILSNLLKLDVLILDTIGPKNRIYGRLNKNIQEGKNYIVASDMVCLGTGVKITKSLIEFLGGDYRGNVALIKTETLDSKHIYKTDATTAIFSIKKGNNKEFGYSITTNLDGL